MSDSNSNSLFQPLARLQIGSAIRGASLLLLATVSAGALVNGFGLAQVRLGGSLHHGMVNVREVLVATERPTFYLIRPVLLAQAIANQDDEAEVLRRIEQLRQFRRDYDAKVQAWTELDLPTEVKDHIRTVENDSKPLWEEIEGTFIPLVSQRMAQEGQPARPDMSQAVAASLGRIMEHFDRHVGEIDALSEHIREVLDRIVVDAEDTSQKVTAISWVTIAVSLGVLLVMMRAATIAIAAPLRTLTGVTEQLAARDYGVSIPFADRGNEIGKLAAALSTLRDTARNAQALEAELAERNRLALAEADRTAAEQDAAAATFSRTLARFLEGDLTARIEGEVSSAYASIKRDLNAGLEQVRSMLSGVRLGMGEIRSSAAEIATAAEDLSRRTETQAANLEETAAAVEQITATVKAAAESSVHTRQVVSATKLDAEKSGEVVERAVVAMSAIEAFSRQISQIIGVIDEIAFQTNLLALNAGVEAARAGEAGRGFAVVATEVRALAQRSAEAAKQIKDLISASTTQVGQGVDLVGQTGQALRRIVHSINEINDLVAGIAAGAAEQSSGLSQVNIAVAQMDQITQQNAAMVEETTAAVRALATQTEGVAVQVDRFHTGADSQASTIRHWSEDAQREAAQTSDEPRPFARRDRAGQPKRALRLAVGGSRQASDDWEEF
ncbi:methyl-accepting chemotaxis protein [Rubellimicrobium roseum]|uniref:HAMP domain-containing protein n=1 Tax=Rubellimicrobium roseum TaxID=687525 RepID=A0A5C4NDZ6_9RHOB|nr:methyl-accepting chemotaxis protein [Rubellimicrobium roseum]TNC72352.1 HAMP domain-containing protein [Rubellimicrobium roseum]